MTGQSTNDLGFGADGLIGHRIVERPHPSGVAQDACEDVSARSENLLSIGQMSRKFSVSLRALRFYEERGLLKPRREGVNRLYDAGQQRRLQQILHGKRLGFTLTDIDRLLAQADGGGLSGFEQVLDPARIDAQIGELERQRQALDQAIVELRAALGRRSGDDEARVGTAA